MVVYFQEKKQENVEGRTHKKEHEVIHFTWTLRVHLDKMGAKSF